MKIINNDKEKLLTEQIKIRKYNKNLADENSKIVDKNNMKWSISVFASVFVIFTILILIPIRFDSFILETFRCVFITAISILLGIPIGSFVIKKFYKPLLGIIKETESMHVTNLLNTYNPLAVARKGNNYLLVLEDKTTKVVLREIINFTYIEKTNINEIILDVDNEKLYIPYKK